MGEGSSGVFGAPGPIQQCRQQLPYGRFGSVQAPGDTTTARPLVCEESERDGLRREQRRNQEEQQHVRGVMGMPRVGRVCNGHPDPPSMPPLCLLSRQCVRRPGPGAGVAHQAGLRGWALHLPEHADGWRQPGMRISIIFSQHTSFFDVVP